MSVSYHELESALRRYIEKRKVLIKHYMHTKLITQKNCHSTLIASCSNSLSNSTVVLDEESREQQINREELQK